MVTNYYELLEIPATSSDDEVRKAIRDQRKRWSQLQGHPKLEVQHEAQLKVRELTEAEAVLTDPDRRLEYDGTIRPPVPVPTYEQPNPAPAFDHRPDPSRQPWQMDREPWMPTPPKPPLLSGRAKKRLAVVAGLAAALAAAVWFVAPAIGAFIRSTTGNFPEMAEERYDGSFDYIITSTDRLVGSAVLGAVIAILLSLLLLRRKKLLSAVVLVAGIVASGSLGVTATSAYAAEARELIMNGMCNGGQGSTGHVELDGKRVDYGLNRDCTALVLWSGTSEIRKIPVPGNKEVELHVTRTESRNGGTYVAAGSWAANAGDPYILAMFRLDEVEDARAIELRAPSRGQGFPILGLDGRFQVERQAGGEGMVTAVDPDTGDFAWNATCPPAWEFLSFNTGEDYNPPGPALSIACVQADADRFRRYAINESSGARGDLVEDRKW